MSHKVSDPVEPVVICDELIHDAIQLPDDEGAVDPGPAKEEMTPDRFHEVTFLSFSYKGTPRSACCVCLLCFQTRSHPARDADILGINNLVGLDQLVKLKLDNNKIWKIQNLDHLVNLQWLGAFVTLLSRLRILVW